MTAVVAALLVVACVAAAATVAGLMLLRDPLDRLHYTGVATVLGGAALTLAVLLEVGVTDLAFKAVVVLVLLVVTGPLLTHVTAQAVVGRREDAADGRSTE